MSSRGFFARLQKPEGTVIILAGVSKRCSGEKEKRESVAYRFFLRAEDGITGERGELIGCGRRS